MKKQSLFPQSHYAFQLLVLMQRLLLNQLNFTKHRPLQM